MLPNRVVLGLFFAALMCGSPALAYESNWVDNGPSIVFSQAGIYRPVQTETAAVYYPSQPIATPQEQSAVWQGLERQNFDENWQSLRTFPLTQTLHTPIRVYLAQTALYKPQFRQYVENSLNQWSNALDGRLKYVLTDRPQEANIRIDWISGYQEADQAGETNAEVGSARITIKVPGLPDNLIEADIMHELGHALGIMCHSENNDDIMKSGHDWSSWQEYKNYRARLSARDIEAIRYLYSSNWHPGEDVYVAIGSEHPPVALGTQSRPKVAMAQKIQSIRKRLNSL